MAVAVETEIKLEPEQQPEAVKVDTEEKNLAGAKHGGGGMRLGRRLGNFIEAQTLGELYGPLPDRRTGSFA